MCLEMYAVKNPKDKNRTILINGNSLYATKKFIIINMKEDPTILMGLYQTGYYYKFDKRGYAIGNTNFQETLLYYPNSFSLDSCPITNSINYKQMLSYHCDMIDINPKRINPKEYDIESDLSPRLLVTFKKKHIQAGGNDCLVVDTFKIVTNYKIYERYFDISEPKRVKKILRCIRKAIKKQTIKE